MMEDYFTKEKRDFLTKVDKSKEAHLDKDITKIVEEICSKDDYYTTSSCAGRIVLIEKLSSKKNDSRWILKKHDRVTTKEIFTSLNNTSIKGDVWFKQEPVILHVRCRDIDSANRFLKESRTVFKRAGIISLNQRKIMIEIIGNERIDTIIAEAGKIIVDMDYIKELVKYANANLVENKRKLRRFLWTVKKNI